MRAFWWYPLLASFGGNCCRQQLSGPVVGTTCLPLASKSALGFVHVGLGVSGFVHVGRGGSLFGSSRNVPKSLGICLEVKISHLGRIKTPPLYPLYLFIFHFRFPKKTLRILPTKRKSPNMLAVFRACHEPRSIFMRRQLGMEIWGADRRSKKPKAKANFTPLIGHQI